MSRDKVGVHYYSERGLVNCLVDWLRQCDNNNLKDFCNDILELNINDEDFNAMTMDIFDEFELGKTYGFGAPDLVIIVSINGSKYIFFIEAKLSGFIKSAEGSYNKIDRQLILKSEFVYALNDVQNRKVGDAIESKQYNKKLSKQVLIDWADEYISNRGKSNKEVKKIEYYYVALVSKDPVDNRSSILQSFFNNTHINNNNFKLITWDIIINNSPEIPNMKETWKVTFGYEKEMPECKKNNRFGG